MPTIWVPGGTEPPDVGTRRWTTRLAGAAAGLLAAAAGVGASALVAALLTGVPTPIISVGNAAVDLAPPFLEDFAINTFGTADKAVLLGGIYTVLALLAVVTGLVGLRWPRTALAVTAGLGVLALVAAATDRTSLTRVEITVAPALVALAVSVLTLSALLARLRQPRAPRRPTVDDVGPGFDRRAFLEAAVATGAIAVGGGVGARLVGGTAAIASRADVRVPTPADPAGPIPRGTELPVDGITRYVTPSDDFYRIDTALTPPDVPTENWTLRVHGMVDREVQLDFAQLLERRLVERRITLACVSNEVGGGLAGNATWIGVPLAELLTEAGVQDGADCLLSTSADGFTASTPIGAVTDGRDAMVALAMNGEPLPIIHGFPARMVVSGLYGFVSATKWLTEIEVTRFDDVEAYWTERDWAEQAPMKTFSRIDVPESSARVSAGTVAVAGVAWAPERGVQRVEVRVDDGEWQQTRLGTEDGLASWRQWVYEWQAEPGSYALEVRATDGTGQTQPEERVPPRPDGATGWHSVSVTVA